MKIEKYTSIKNDCRDELPLDEPYSPQNPINGSQVAAWEAQATRDLIGWGLSEPESCGLAAEIQFGTFPNLRIGRRAANLIEDGLPLILAEVQTVAKFEEWGLSTDTAKGLFAEFKFGSIAHVILQRQS